MEFSASLVFFNLLCRSKSTSIYMCTFGVVGDTKEIFLFFIFYVLTQVKKKKRYIQLIRLKSIELEKNGCLFLFLRVLTKSQTSPNWEG